MLADIVLLLEQLQTFFSLWKRARSNGRVLADIVLLLEQLQTFFSLWKRARSNGRVLADIVLLLEAKCARSNGRVFYNDNETVLFLCVCLFQIKC